MKTHLLFESTVNYLKSLITEAVNRPIADDELSISFEKLGLDSSRSPLVIEKLETYFGSLSKTLLSEHDTIEDLASYLLTAYEPLITKKLLQREWLATQKLSAGPRSTSKLSTNEYQDSQVNSNNQLLTDEPITRISEQEAYAHPELRELIDGIFKRYSNEGAASRGTRSIAPYLFVGSEKRGYFNYSQLNDVIFVYAYTGPKDYFGQIIREIFLFCNIHHFELNIFTSEPLSNVADTPFSATPFGVLSRIDDIQNFSLEGGRMRRLRYQVSKFKKKGRCRTEEYLNGSNKGVDRNIAEIIGLWCSSKKRVNPFIYTVKEEILAGRLSGDHRLFVTYLENILVNVILISKLSTSDNGYLMDLEFYSPQMALGGLEFAIVEIIRTLASEGYEVLSLGGTYGCKLPPSATSDPMLDDMLTRFRDKNVLNDEGNFQFKNKFRPINSTIFLCRPLGAKPDTLTDIIRMIAHPVQTPVLNKNNELR